jgi:basic membrane lipoprotein Med (substrate-binding protein (PBP1-ABC) superfamily)
MKRLRVVFLAMVFAALFGCDGGQQQANVNPIEADPGDFKVALITPNSVNDSGWSALAYEGLLKIGMEMGAETQNVVASSPAEIADAMRSYAQKEFDLVIGHGYEYNAIGMEVGADFPDTVFVSTSGDKFADNVGTFRFYLEQATYLCGMIAAELSKTGTIGMVGGPNVPSIESTFQAFEAGAKSVNPKIKVLKAYTNSNDDVGAAKQQTLAFIDQGADMIIHQANAAAGGVFEACDERGVLAFGTNSDQKMDAPPRTVLASAVIVAGPAFLDLATRVKEDKFEAGVNLQGMKEGAVDLVWNETITGGVPQELKDLIEATKKKIISGELVVPKLEF